jgi:hypothetical protein
MNFWRNHITCLFILCMFLHCDLPIC